MANKQGNVVPLREADVGYKRPPTHSQFKRGQSGNPSGRPKGSQNLKTLFNKLLKEEVSLRDGADVRKVSKAEAILRSLLVSALKGDQRAVATMFRLAEQAGHFEEQAAPITQITRVIVTGVPRAGDELPANSDISREQP